MNQYNDLDFDNIHHNVESNVVVKDKIEEMRNIYADTQKYLPPNEPYPRGFPIQLN